MRYIKKYNLFNIESKLFENSDYDKKLFEEMFYDLSDIGHDVRITVDYCDLKLIPDNNKHDILNSDGFSKIAIKEEKYHIVVEILMKSNQECSISDIKDTLLFAESYCVEVGYKFEWVAIRLRKFRDFNICGDVKSLCDNISGDSPLYNVFLYFSKDKYSKEDVDDLPRYENEDEIDNDENYFDDDYFDNDEFDNDEEG